jgi:hypothetical protein
MSVMLSTELAVNCELSAYFDVGDHFKLAFEISSPIQLRVYTWNAIHAKAAKCKFQKAAKP